MGKINRINCEENMTEEILLNTSVEERQIKDKETLLGALKEMPIIQVACKKAGVSRATYYRWRQEDKIFKRQSMDALDQGVEFINDMSESQLITLIKKEKMPAITLWLKNNHPRFSSKAHGYIPIASADEMTPEEQKMMIDALRMTSGNTSPHKKHDRNNSRISGTDQKQQKS